MLGAVTAWLLIFTSTASAVAATEIPNRQELVALLKHKKYDLLDTRLTSYQKVFQADFRQENNVDVAFWTFFRTDPSLETYLNEWISEYPRSYAARLARGVYYSAVAFKKRGTKVASETTGRQMSGMQLYLGKAQKDLTVAIEINPKLIQAYAMMIYIPMAFGLRAQTKAIIEEALERNPYSLSARWSYLVSLEPRWGGSFREMEDFIRQARPYYMKNPELKVLNGRVLAARGDHATTYGKALFYFNKALAHGKHWYFYRRRGEILNHLQRYREAIASLDKALERRPVDPRALRLRGLSHWGAGNYDKSIADLTAAIGTDPTDHELINTRGGVHYHFHKYKPAFEDFERALRLNPRNAKYLENKKKALQAIKQSQ